MDIHKFLQSLPPLLHQSFISHHLLLHHLSHTAVHFSLACQELHVRCMVSAQVGFGGTRAAELPSHLHVEGSQPQHARAAPPMAAHFTYTTPSALLSGRQAQTACTAHEICLSFGWFGMWQTNLPPHQ